MAPRGPGNLGARPSRPDSYWSFVCAVWSRTTRNERPGARDNYVISLMARMVNVPRVVSMNAAMDAGEERDEDDIGTQLADTFARGCAPGACDGTHDGGGGSGQTGQRRLHRRPHPGPE